MPTKKETQRVVNIALTVVLYNDATTWTDEEINNMLKIKSADRDVFKITSHVAAED